MDNNPFNYIPLQKRIEATIRMSQRKVTGEKVTHIAQDMNINRTHLYSLEDKYVKG